MSPPEGTTTATSPPPSSTTSSIDGEANPDSDPQLQYLFVIRHGDRWDYSNPSWKSLPNKRTGDSPLSKLGHNQARETGIWLNKFLKDKKLSLKDDVVWLSSPFLRCLQTSDGALNAMTSSSTTTDGDDDDDDVVVDDIDINVEYSIFEWDGHDGSWHADLPSVVEERQHYFPRINLNYKSIFVPDLPEPRSKFFDRCRRSVNGIMQRFPFKAGQVIVCVSHAAGCLALARALSGKQLNEITPAGPCSIYGFTRSNDIQTTWDLDEHDVTGSLNGYTSHLSNMGTATKPWHNFGDGITKFYTGPITSRFAPTQLSATKLDEEEKKKKKVNDQEEKEERKQEEVQ